ncbi:hypothetical protein [Sphingobium aromaticiconvertens]|uniref:hypothetical protein n=1 Tax=Sphingobium aromaticiconvertens TaxID=365341 RepID=UPI003019A524
MIYAAALGHPREQGAFAVVADPFFGPTDEGLVDVGIGDGGADGMNMGGDGNDGLPLLGDGSAPCSPVRSSGIIKRSGC